MAKALLTTGYPKKNTMGLQCKDNVEGPLAFECRVKYNEDDAKVAVMVRDGDFKIMLNSPVFTINAQRASSPSRNQVCSISGV